MTGRFVTFGEVVLSITVDFPPQPSVERAAIYTSFLRALPLRDWQRSSDPVPRQPWREFALSYLTKRFSTRDSDGFLARTFSDQAPPSPAR